VAHHGRGHARDVVGRDVVAAGQPRGRPGGAEQVDRGARGGAELDARQLAGAADDVDDVARDLLLDPRGVDFAALNDKLIESLRFELKLEES